jgi:hypothetical protein
MIDNYLDFITENKLQLILEANIIYSKKFREIIDQIDSPIARELNSFYLNNKDIDRNYIDITTKDDTVLFRLQDKLNKAESTLINTGFVYDNLSKKVFKEKSNIRWEEPYNGIKGHVVKDISLEEIIEINSGGEGIWRYMYENSQFLVLFEYEINDQKYFCFVNKSAVKTNLDNVPKTEIGVGRFVRAFLNKLGKSINDKELEDFVDKFKKIRQLDMNALDRFKIISGEDIRKYYSFDTYEKNAGSLGGSCMKYAECQDYLDIYVDNPDTIQMIIFMSDKEGLISGRALLWTDNKGRKIMDRIYIIRTSDIHLFKEYAIVNNFYNKTEQDYKDYTPFELNGKELSKVDNIITVKVKDKDYQKYPYMDTLKYFLPERGIISNNYIDACLILNDTHGGYEGNDD